MPGDVYDAFRCPVCGSRKYVAVRVRRAGGNWYLTEFYECFGCSAMFRDPVKFSGHVNSGDGIDRSPRTYVGGSPKSPKD